MKKDNLYAFGCSYTQYSWPTWVDCLTPYFKNTYNYGRAGAGNSYIFSTFSYATLTNNIKEGDTVIIIWSGLPREDRIFPDNLNYSTAGSIYCNLNYDLDYVDTLHNPVQQAMELLFYINHIKTYCKLNKVNLKMSYILEPWIEDFLGEPNYQDLKVHHRGVNILGQTDLLERLQGVSQDENFTEQGIEMSREDKEKLTPQYYAFEIDKFQIDYHPTPTQHHNYALKHLIPWLKSDLEIDHTKVNKILIEWNKVISTREFARYVSINNANVTKKFNLRSINKEFNSNLETKEIDFSKKPKLL